MNQIDYEYNAHVEDRKLRYKLEVLEARIGKIEKLLGMDKPSDEKQEEIKKALLECQELGCFGKGIEPI